MEQGRGAVAAVPVVTTQVSTTARAATCPNGRFHKDFGTGRYPGGMSGAYVRTRPRRSEVRARILDAAMEVFAAEGFDGASINAIATVAGFTKGAVYSNFESKDELFLALIDRQITQRADAVLASLADVSDDPQALVGSIGQRLMESVHANPQWQMLFFEFCVRAMRNDDVRLRFVEHRRVVRERIAETTAALQERLGITAMSADALTMLVMSLSNGLAIEEMVDPGAVPTNLISDVLDHLRT